MQRTHIKLYMLEQLPVIAPGDYDRQFGNTTARELVRDHVLRLTYTSHDMAPFARDLGYSGAPFTWDEEERRHLRARLDALYFHLYGLDRDDAGYVLGTFPIVQKHDQAQFGQLPHPRPNPRLHERPLRRRRGDGGSGVAGRKSSSRPPFRHWYENDVTWPRDCPNATTLQSTSMPTLHRRILPSCRPMADGGMRKCSAGACPPLGRRRGVAESAVPIRRTKPQLQLFIPWCAGANPIAMNTGYRD